LKKTGETEFRPEISKEKTVQKSVVVILRQTFLLKKIFYGCTLQML
jgi:hypothetical protein